MDAHISWLGNKILHPRRVPQKKRGDRGFVLGRLTLVERTWTSTEEARRPTASEKKKTSSPNTGRTFRRDESGTGEMEKTRTALQLPVNVAMFQPKTEKHSED